MSGKLEKFIKENRGQMDELVPSDKLWASISTGVAGGSAFVFFKSKIAWLKFFGFGASALVIAVATYTYLNKTEIGPKKQDAALTQIEPGKKEEVKAEEIHVLVHDSTKTKKKVSEPKVKEPIVKNELTAPIIKNDTVIAPVAKTASAALVSNSVVVAPLVSSVSTAYGTSTCLANDNRQESQVNIKANETRDTILKDVSNLVLIACCADVSIKALKSEDVHMKAVFSCEKKGLVKTSDYRLNYTRAGESLTITLSNVNKNQVYAGSLIINNTIELEVPEGINIKTKTSSGNTTVQGLNGKIKEFHSNSGDISVQNIEKNIKISTAHGNVNIKKVEGDLELKVSSGDIKVSDLTGNLKCGSAFGNCRIDNIKGDMKLSSSSGDIHIKNAEGKAHITSAHGNITFENYKGRPELSATSGDITGKNVLILEKMTAKTAFGNINMQLSNPMKDLSFNAKSTHGVIKVDKDGEKTNISGSYLMNNGKIMIETETVSGDQYYK